MKNFILKLTTFIILTFLVAIIPLSIAIRVPALPPTPPKNLTVESQNGRVILRWDAATATDEHPVIWYYIYRGNSSKNEAYLTKVDASVSSYIDNNVIIGHTYYYYVTAINDVGESEPSNEVNITVKDAKTIPQPPRNLFAIRGDGYVVLGWNPPSYNGGSPIITYNIYRNGKILASVNSSSTQYNDSSVDIKEKYVYYVSAVNAIGESEPSNKVTVKWFPPNAPQNVEMKNVEDYVILTWQPGDSGGLKIKEYRIYEKTENGWILIGNTTQTIFKIKLPTSLWGGGSLKIKITEVTDLGESDGALIEIPIPSDTFMLYLLMIMFALIVILIIAIYYKWRR